MVEENQIGEFAVIFNRKKTDDESIVQFIPVRVVEGYYCEEDGFFVDLDQYVYPHMANLVDYGNVYACRVNVLELLNKNKDSSIMKIKKEILDSLSKYEYYKNMNEDAEEYAVIMMRNKETGEFSVFRDKDSDEYYEIHLVDEKKESEESKEEPSKGATVEREKVVNYTPSQIVAEVKKTIKGQDKAIETIATLLWIKYNLPMMDKTNMLVIGPTGVGKTAIFRKMKQIFDVPLAIYSVTGTSQAGYKGHDIEEMLIQLYLNSGMDIDKTQNGIVIIDEFDKLSGNREQGEIGTTAIQNELLKLVEGCERQISLDSFNTINIDTTNIVFVGCGAFSDLFNPQKDVRPSIGFNNYPEEKKANDVVIDTETIIKKGGIISELAGRLPVIVRLNELSREDLKDILLNSDESKLMRTVETIESMGVTIENLDVIVDGLVDKAIKAKIGARGLTKSVAEAFLKIIKDLGDNPDKYDNLIIGPNIIEDNTDYQLVPKKVKKRVKTAEV